MPVNCYSQRILNPFRGVMNIISIGGADAVTIDGKNWTLYIHDNFDCPTDDPEEFFEIDMPDIRFGDWSQQQGLRRSPLIESYHYNEIQSIGQSLLDAVEKNASRIPFIFRDHYELWLLDEQTTEPLALIASACKRSDLFFPKSIVWEAGIRCKHEFNCLDEQDTTLTAGERLNRLINHRSGSSPSAQWFFRNEQHYGIGLGGINLDNNLVGRELSARIFPKLLVTQQWQNADNAHLVNAFIDWLSPYLLIIDRLRDEQRISLEASARKQAMLVDRLHMLYPKVINQQAINAARVEAMMRRANTTRVKDEVDSLELVEYLELQPASN